MGSSTESEVKDLEERLSKLVPLLESIAKGNVQMRNSAKELMEMQVHLMENQTAMMNDVQYLRADSKEMVEDIKKMREAILFVFELVISGGSVKSSRNELRQSARMTEDLAKGGIKALAEHNSKEALNFIAKLQSASSK